MNMDTDLSEVQIGFVVSLEVLREVLRGLNVDGRQWWISSDPNDAVEDGFITIAHGTKQCSDHLNILHFRVPVVRSGDGKSTTDRLVLMFEPSTTTPEELGFCFENGHIGEDLVEDFFQLLPAY